MHVKKDKWYLRREEPPKGKRNGRLYWLTAAAEEALRVDEEARAYRLTEKAREALANGHG